MPYWAAAQLQPQRTGSPSFVSARPAMKSTPPACGSHGPRTAARWSGPRYFSPATCSSWIELQWHTARWAPGVTRIVLAGGVPAVVPEGVIMALKARETGGLIDLPRPPKFRTGDRLRVTSGPFAGHVGLYAGMKPRERVEVLLAILGGSQRVTLAADAVEAAL